MKRGHGDGGIDAHGENTWRLRYRINGQRFTKTVQGTKAQAQKALRDLLHAVDTGAHVAPDRMTLGQLRERTRPGLGIVQPCLPSPAKAPPSGSGWIHEIKHDGFRILARRSANGVRLYTRNGYDFAHRFPRIVEAIAQLPARSCFIDGEAIVVDERGLSAFDLLRSWRHEDAAVLCAFDLIELDGHDFRRSPLEQRKDWLAELLRAQRSADGVVLNEHYEGDGAITYKHACGLGCEGIVSKRRGSPYRSGRVHDWLKVKNPVAPAVKREAEEDWGGTRRLR